MTKLISRKVTQKDNANRSVNFPVIGVAVFDKDGLLEVDADKVEELISLTEESFDFEIHGKPKAPGKKSGEELSQFMSDLDSLTEEQLMELVGGTDDEDFKSKAPGMPIQRVKERLAKIMLENSKEPEEEKKEEKKKRGRPAKVVVKD